jgi:hypothetical protein
MRARIPAKSIACGAVSCGGTGGLGEREGQSTTCWGRGREGGREARTQPSRSKITPRGGRADIAVEASPRAPEWVARRLLGRRVRAARAARRSAALPIEANAGLLRISMRSCEGYGDYRLQERYRRLCMVAFSGRCVPAVNACMSCPPPDLSVCLRCAAGPEC